VSVPTLAPLAHNFERPKFCLSLVPMDLSSLDFDAVFLSDVP